MAQSESVSEVVARLADPRAAGEVLHELARRGGSAVPGLVAELEGGAGSRTARALLVRALARTGPAAAPAVPALLAALTGADAAMQTEVFRALAEIGPVAREHCADLVARLQAHEPSTGFAADERAIALAVLQADLADEADLLAALADERIPVRVAAARVLALRGCERREVQEAVAAAHARAARAWEEIGDWELREALDLARSVLAVCRDRAALLAAHKTLLLHHDPRLRLASATALRDVAGGHAGVAIALAGVLQLDPPVVLAALAGLAQCGDEALFVLPELDDWRYQARGELITAARATAAQIRERLSPAGRAVDAYLRGDLAYEELVRWDERLHRPLAFAFQQPDRRGLLPARPPAVLAERMVAAGRWLVGAADPELAEPVAIRVRMLDAKGRR